MGFNKGPLKQHKTLSQTNLAISIQPADAFPIIIMSSKAAMARKAIYLHKLHNLLKNNNTQIIAITADNLRVRDIQTIRQDLRSHSLVVMGKNTWMKRSLAIHAPSTGKPAFVGMIPHIVGKVGLVLTAHDPEDVSEVVAGYKLHPLVCSSMDIGMCNLWQWLLGFHFDLLGKAEAV